MADQFEPSNNPLITSPDGKANVDITNLGNYDENTSLDDIKGSYTNVGNMYGNLAQNAAKDVSARQVKLIGNDFGGVNPQLQHTYYEPAETSFKSMMNMEGTQKALDVGMERGKAAAEANLQSAQNDYNNAVNAYENFRNSLENGQYAVAEFDASALPEGMTLEEFENLMSSEGMDRETFLNISQERIQNANKEHPVDWNNEEDARAANDTIFKKYNTTWENIQSMSEKDREAFWKRNDVSVDWRNAFYENQIRRSVGPQAVEQYRRAVSVNLQGLNTLYDSFEQGVSVLDNLGMVDNMCVALFSLPEMKSTEEFTNKLGGTSTYGMDDNFDTMSIEQRNNLLSASWLKENLDEETFNEALKYMMDNRMPGGIGIENVEYSRQWVNGMYDIVKTKLHKQSSDDNALAQFSYASIADTLGFSTDDLKSYIAVKRSNPELLTAMKQSYSMARGLTSIMEVADGSKMYLINGEYRTPEAGTVVMMAMPGTTNNDGSFNSKEYETALKALQDLNNPTANHTDEERKALEDKINENFNAYYKQCAYQSAIQAIKPGRKDFKNMFLEALVLSDVEKYKDLVFTNDKGEKVTAGEFLRDFNNLIKENSGEAYKLYSDALYQTYKDHGYIYIGSDDGSVHMIDIMNGDKKHTNVFSYDNDKQGSGSETYQKYGHGLSADTIFNLISAGINIYNKKGKSDKQEDQDFSYYVDPKFIRGGVIGDNGNFSSFVNNAAYSASQFAGIIFNAFSFAGSFIATGFENTANTMTGRGEENKNPFTESKFVTWDTLTGSINNAANGLNNDASEYDGQTLEELFTAPRVEDSYAQWFELNEHQQNNVARAINATTMYTWFGTEDGGVKSEGLGGSGNASKAVADNAFLKNLNESGVDFLGISNMFAGDYQFWSGAGKFAGTIGGYKLMSGVTSKVAGAVREAASKAATNINLSLSSTILKQAADLQPRLATALASSSDIAATASTMAGTAAANTAINSAALGGKITEQAIKSAKMAYSKTAAGIANGTINAEVTKNFSKAFVDTVKQSKYYGNLVSELGAKGAEKFLSNMSTNASAVMQEIVSNSAIGNLTGLSVAQVSNLTARDQRLLTKIIEGMGNSGTVSQLNKTTWFKKEFLKSLTPEELTEVTKAILDGTAKNAALGLKWTAEDTARILQSKGWMNASKSVFMKEFARDFAGDIFRDNIRNLTNPYYTDEGYRRQSVEEYFTNPNTWVQNFLSSSWQFAKQRLNAEVMTSISTHMRTKALNAVASTGDATGEGSLKAMARAQYWSAQAQKWSNAAFKSGVNYSKLKTQIDNSSKFTFKSQADMYSQMGVDADFIEVETGGTKYRFENTEEFKKWSNENKVDSFDAINVGLKSATIDAEGRYVVNAIELGGDQFRGLGALKSADMLIDMHRIEIDTREANIDAVKADTSLNIVQKSERLYDMMTKAIVQKYGKNELVDGLEKSLRMYYQNFLDELSSRVEHYRKKGMSEDEILQANLVRLGYTPIASWYNQTPFEDSVLRGFSYGSQTIDKVATDTTQGRGVYERDLLEAFARGETTYQLKGKDGEVIKEYILDKRGLNYLDSLTVYHNSNMVKRILTPIFGQETNGRFDMAGSALRMRYAYIESTETATKAATYRRDEADRKINEIIGRVTSSYTDANEGASEQSIKAYEAAKNAANEEAEAILANNKSNRERLIEYAQNVRNSEVEANRISNMNAGALPKEYEAVPALVLGLYEADTPMFRFNQETGRYEGASDSINVEAGKIYYDNARKDVARLVKYYNDGALDDSGSLTTLKKSFTSKDEEGKNNRANNQTSLLDEFETTKDITLSNGAKIQLDENDMSKIIFAAANGQQFDADLVTSIMIKSRRAEIDEAYNKIKTQIEEKLAKLVPNPSELYQKSDGNETVYYGKGKNTEGGVSEEVSGYIIANLEKKLGKKLDDMMVLGTEANDLARSEISGLLTKSRIDDADAGVSSSVLTDTLSSLSRKLAMGNVEKEEYKQASAQRKYREWNKESITKRVEDYNKKIAKLNSGEFKVKDAVDLITSLRKNTLRFGDFAPQKVKKSIADIEASLKSKGYEISSLAGRKMNDGMNVKIIADKSTGDDKYIIQEQRPMVVKDGKIVQKAEVVVGDKANIEDPTSDWRKIYNYMYSDTGLMKDVTYPDGNTGKAPLYQNESSYMTFTVSEGGRYSGNAEGVYDIAFTALGENLRKFNKDGNIDRTDAKLMASMRTQLDTQLRSRIGETITIGGVIESLNAMLPDARIYKLAKDTGLITKFSSLDADGINVPQLRNIICDDFITKKSTGKLDSKTENTYLKAIQMLSNMEESAARPKLMVDSHKLETEDGKNALDNMEGGSGTRAKTDAEEFLDKYLTSKQSETSVYDRNEIMDITKSLSEVLDGLNNRRSKFYSQALASAHKGKKEVDKFIEAQIDGEGGVLEAAKALYKTNNEFKGMVDGWTNHRKEMQKAAGVKTISDEPGDNEFLNALGLVRPKYELTSTGNSKNHKTAEEYYAAIDNIDSVAVPRSGFSEGLYNRIYTGAASKGVHLEQLQGALQLLRDFGVEMKDITPEINSLVEKLDYSQLTVGQLNYLQAGGPVAMLPAKSEAKWNRMLSNGETISYTDISKWQNAKRSIDRAKKDMSKAISDTELMMYRSDMMSADETLNSIYAKFKTGPKNSKKIDALFEETITQLGAKNGEISALLGRRDFGANGALDNIENSFYGVASYVDDPSIKRMLTLSEEEASRHANAIKQRIDKLTPKKPGTFEASTAGQKEFSPLNAKFADGTEIMGIDISGKTIEDVYQTTLKGSGKNQVPTEDSPIGKATAEAEAKAGRKLTKAEQEAVSQNFLNRLYDIWGEQNPEMKKQIEGLEPGTKITDQFAKTGVSQANSLQRWVPSNEAISVKTYTGNITPDESTIFVFGSNPEGRHGAGAAKTAKEQFGAVYGQGEGLQGNSYAIPTKDLSKGKRSITPEKITESIAKMYATAEQNPDKQFKVAYRSDNNLNGYNLDELATMFKNAGNIPDNVYFSEEMARRINSQSDYTNHSGGAVGSDTVWGEIGGQYGVKSNHYYHGQKTPNGNTEISKADFEEGKQHVLKANETLSRKPDKYMDLLARNWQQVKNADAVFAIGERQENAANIPMVKGGTGWAVQMALDAGKTVNFFDQSVGKWFTVEDNKWAPIDTPVLTKNFAGIGTREINENGRAAIEDVYRKSFGKESTPESQELARLRAQYDYFSNYKDRGYVDPTTGKQSLFTRRQVENNLPAYSNERSDRGGLYEPAMRRIDSYSQLPSNISNNLGKIIKASLGGKKKVDAMLTPGAPTPEGPELNLIVNGKYTEDNIRNILRDGYGLEDRDYDIVGTQIQERFKDWTNEGRARWMEAMKDVADDAAFNRALMKANKLIKNPDAQEQLNDLNKQRAEAVARLVEARSFGDLSENEEYRAAKDNLKQTENSIHELLESLKTPLGIRDENGNLIRNPEYISTDNSKIAGMLEKTDDLIWRIIPKTDDDLYRTTDDYETSMAKRFKEGMDLGEGWVTGGERINQHIANIRKTEEKLETQYAENYRRYNAARNKMYDEDSYLATTLSNVINRDYSQLVTAEDQYAKAYSDYIQLSEGLTNYKQRVAGRANEANKELVKAIAKYEQYFKDANPEQLLMEKLLRENKTLYNKMMAKKNEANSKLEEAEQTALRLTGAEEFEQLKALIRQKHDAEKFLNSTDERSVYTSPEGDVFARDGYRAKGSATVIDALKSLGWDDSYVKGEDDPNEYYTKENRKKRKAMQKEINKNLNQNASGRRTYKPYEAIDFTHLDEASRKATMNNILDFQDSMKGIMKSRYGIDGEVNAIVDKNYLDLLQVIVARDKAGVDNRANPFKSEEGFKGKDVGDAAKYVGKESVNKFLTITRAGVQFAKSTQDFQMAGGFANINAMTIVQLRQYMYQQFSLNPLKASKAIKDFINVAYNTRNSAAAYNMAAELMPFMQKNADIIGDTNPLTDLNGVLSRSPGYNDGGTVNSLVSNWLRHIDEIKDGDYGEGSKIKKLFIQNPAEDFKVLFTDATFKNTLPLFRAWMLKKNYDEALRFLNRTGESKKMTSEELDRACHAAAYCKTLEFFEPAKTRGKTLSEILENSITAADRRRLASFTGMERGASYLDVASNVFFALRYKMTLGGQVVSGFREALSPSAIMRKGRLLLGKGETTFDENGAIAPGRNDALDTFIHSGSLRGVGALATIAVINHFWCKAMGIPSPWDSTQYVDEQGNLMIPEILKKIQTIGQFWMPNEWSKERGYYFDPNKKMTALDTMSSTFTLTNSVFKTADKGINTKAYNHNQRGVGLIAQELGINPQGLNNILNNDVVAAVGDELIASNMLSPWKAMYEVLTDNTYFGNNIWEKKYLPDGSENKNYDPFRNMTASFFHILNLDWFLTDGTNAWVKGKYKDYENRVVSKDYVAQDNIGTVAGSGVFQHEFVTAAIHIIKGDALEGIIEAGELPIKTRNLSTQARTEFNTKIKNTVMQLAEEYKAKVENVTDPDVKDRYYKEFVKQAADVVASWSKKWDYVLGENQQLVAYATRALMAICAGEYDDNLNYVQNAYWKASQLAQIEQPASLFLGDEDLEEWIKSGKTEEEFAKEREKRSAAWNQALLDEYDAIQALKEAGVDTSYLTREAADYFDAMKSSINKKVYEGIHEALKQPIGEFENMKEMKAYYEEQIAASTSTKTKAKLAEKYNGYLKEVLAPYVNKYGEGIFKYGYYNGEGLSNSIADYVIIPADKYYRGKTPRASYLKDMYGVGYTDRSNLPSDDELIERFVGALRTANSGSTASASRLLDGIIKDVKSGRLYVTNSDYSKIVNMKALLSARSK